MTNEKIVAAKDNQFKFDDKGFFVIMVDKDRRKIVVEHYLNVEHGKALGTGKLNKIIEGEDAEAICDTIISGGLVSRLEHAAYLGKELQKAEIALKNNLNYEQDEQLQLE